jgi:hypothetical protein
MTFVSQEKFTSAWLGALADDFISKSAHDVDIQYRLAGWPANGPLFHFRNTIW